MSRMPLLIKFMLMDVSLFQWKRKVGVAKGSCG